MVQIKPKQIGVLLLCVLLGTVLLSSVYLMDVSGTQGSFGLIAWGAASALVIPLFILFLVGVFCGALVIYLLKISKGIYVLLTSLVTGILTVFCYGFITLLANLEYLFSPRQQHYAWSGALGYIGDAFFVFSIVIFAFGIFIILGFIVGAAVQLLIIKKKTSVKKEMS